VRVAGGGPAELAGIEVGDIVVGVGGDSEQIKDQADFYRRIWKSGPAGSRVALRLLQGGSLKEVLVESVDRHDFLLHPAGI
jgi:S1-C subfamily serine protease